MAVLNAVGDSAEKVVSQGTSSARAHRDEITAFLLDTPDELRDHIAVSQMNKSGNPSGSKFPLDFPQILNAICSPWI